MITETTGNEMDDLGPDLPVIAPSGTGSSSAELDLVEDDSFDNGYSRTDTDGNS